MRQQYETEKDRQNEKAVAAVIESVWGLTAVKMPMSYHLDYALTNAGTGLRGFAEIKCRTNMQYDYPTYMISLSKVITANRLSAVTGLGCILVVKWLDDVGWINFNTEHELGIGGRKDRDDCDDQEPVAYFKIPEFKPLKG
jgi:hypothetical protein